MTIYRTKKRQMMKQILCYYLRTCKKCCRTIQKRKKYYIRRFIQKKCPNYETMDSLWDPVLPKKIIHITRKHTNFTKYEKIYIKKKTKYVLKLFSYITHHNKK